MGSLPRVRTGSPHPRSGQVPRGQDGYPPPSLTGRGWCALRSRRRTFLFSVMIDSFLSHVQLRGAMAIKYQSTTLVTYSHCLIMRECLYEFYVFYFSQVITLVSQNGKEFEKQAKTENSSIETTKECTAGVGKAEESSW